MPRARTPLAKAKATGRTIVNPARFKDRKEPKSKPLGKPSPHLDEDQCRAWESFKREMPWLMESDRGLVEAASMLRAALWEGLDVKVVTQLRICLSAMGGTPADRSKVGASDDEETDPADDYLN